MVVVCAKSPMQVAGGEVSNTKDARVGQSATVEKDEVKEEEKDEKKTRSGSS